MFDSFCIFTCYQKTSMMQFIRVFEASASVNLTIKCYRISRYHSKEQKNCLAMAIITSLPGLKDPNGLTGHVSIIKLYGMKPKPTSHVSPLEIFSWLSNSNLLGEQTFHRPKFYHRPNKRMSYEVSNPKPYSSVMFTLLCRLYV